MAMNVFDEVLLVALVFTYFVNIPFGYWRAHTKITGSKLEWIAAAHLPVPLIFTIRVLAGVSMFLIPFS